MTVSGSSCELEGRADSTKRNRGKTATVARESYRSGSSVKKGRCQYWREGEDKKQICYDDERGSKIEIPKEEVRTDRQ